MKDVDNTLRALEVYGRLKIKVNEGKVENIVGNVMLDAVEIIRELKKRLDKLDEVYYTI